MSAAAHLARPPAIERLEGRVVVLATMHGKEAVLAPLLESGLGVRTELVQGLDTDAFGTFSREVPRRGTQLEAARAKAQAALERTPAAALAVASEGSFGPHPLIPFGAGGYELVLLLERETGLELVGHDVSEETNFAHQVVTSSEEALAFAARVGFPSHALLAMAVRDGRPAPGEGLFKGLRQADELLRTVERLAATHGAAHLEADMRAHLNPTRMRSIERATRDLVRRALSACPSCGAPGFDVIDGLRGLPCEACARPTRLLVEEVLGCRFCPMRVGRAPAHGLRAAPARWCDQCNP